MSSAIVFGASGGIGRALVEQLALSGSFATVYAAARTEVTYADPRISALHVDLTNETTLRDAARATMAEIDLVFIATGLLHDAESGLMPEKSYRAIDAHAFANVLEVNTIGPALIAKHFLAKLPRQKRSAFVAISARVGSIGDNGLGGWHAYRASKAALNMLIANFAIEIRRTHPHAIIAALHPGTVATDLSSPFCKHGDGARIATPQKAATDLLDVTFRLTPEDNGGFFAWDASRLPW